MLNKILNRDDVLSFLKELVTEDVYLNKDIPNKIYGEKINKTEYPLYTFIDAVVKYCIIIEDIELFDNYLDQLKRIIKKVESHNDIQMGVIKLLIKYVSHKLNLTDLDNTNNKKKIIDFFYNKYIVEGYFYHSFPSIYKSNVSKNGVNNYTLPEELIEIDSILNKYKIEGLFTEEFDRGNHISITDSLFMAYFYAVSAPYYLEEISINLDRSKKTNDKAYMLKNYDKCKNNINEVIKRKEMKEKDKNILMDFFNREWERLDISNSIPITAMIKRKYINKNSLSNYNEILEKSINLDISSSIKKIFESRYNEENINISIPADKLELIELPNIKELCKEKEKKVTNEDNNTSNDIIHNEEGNATVVALIGILLITLGVTVTIIMLGK